MVKYLLLLILLVLVLGPLGLFLGFGIGVVLLLIIVPVAIVGFLARGLARGGSAIGAALPPLPLPGEQLAGDHVRKEADGWWAIVAGERFGPWSDRAMAQAVLAVEQRKASARG